MAARGQSRLTRPFGPNRLPRRFFPVALLAISFGLALSIHAQQLPTPVESGTGAEESAGPPEVENRPTVESVEAELAELATQLENAEAGATEETVERLSVTLEDLNARVDRMRALGGVLQQQIGAIQRLDELRSSADDLAQEVAVFEERGPEESPPYSLEYADLFNDEWIAEQRALESLQAQLESDAAELETAKERLAEAGRARRALQESLGASNDAAQPPGAVWQLNRARLEERFLEESIQARELRREVTEAEIAVATARVEFALNKAGTVFELTRFTQDEYQTRISELASKRDEIERRLPSLRDTHQANEALRRQARDGLSAAQGDSRIAAATTVLAARTAWVETAARAVELTEKKLRLADEEKILWDRRYAVWRGAEDAELAEWQKETERFLEEIDRDRQVQQARMIDLRATMLAVETQLASWTEQQGEKSVAETRLQALQKREASLNDYLATLLPVERLAGRVRDDIEREYAHVTWSERWARVLRILGGIWSFEIFVFEDDSITVSKIVIALAILIIGVLLAGFVTRTLRSRVLGRTRLTENAAASMEKLIYYVSVILILLYALNFVNIPLTLFAFFGGAIAIAVGFGAQHLINNFISGFILMLERPIRIGDLVQIDGTYGHIRHIGARSTRLHSAENIDLLIPNSKLLENTVTNWTLSDERLRTSVTVGVIYGSPVELVTELLTQATLESKRVMDTPKPIVLFTDFGDDALTFEIHFWIKMRRIMDKRQAESEIRYNVDRLFRENDLVIAFPQRDVHLDTSSPLQIEMIDRNDKRDEN